MVWDELENILEKEKLKIGFYKNEKIFDKDYFPKNILHRDEEIKKLVVGLGGIMRNEKPFDVLIFGKSGTGKTLITNIVLKRLKDKLKDNFHFFIFNCREGNRALTTHQILTSLIKRKFGQSFNRGYGTDELITFLFDKLQTIKGHIIFVFDEMDSFLEKNGDGFIYTISRINEIRPDFQGSASIIGISNKNDLSDLLDNRVQSSLNTWPLVFNPYNAVQLGDILREREKEGLNQEKTEEDFIPKISAYGAREHGDVRKALDLFKKCISLAVEKDQEILSSSLIDDALHMINVNRIFEIMATAPRHLQILVYSLLKIHYKEKINVVTNNKNIIAEPLTMGDLYDKYSWFCNALNIKPLNYNTIYQHLAELQNMGMIRTTIVSRGRYGRTSFIKINYPMSVALELQEKLKEDLDL